MSNDTRTAERMAWCERRGHPQELDVTTYNDPTPVHTCPCGKVVTRDD